MINHLAEILNEFPGSANRTRCFTHILNLVAKCIMRQFDSPKAKTSDFEVVVERLADDLEDSDVDGMEEDNELDNYDIDEEIVNGRKGMGEEDVEALEESVKPVKQVLFKVLFVSWQC